LAGIGQSVLQANLRSESAHVVEIVQLVSGCDRVRSEPSPLAHVPRQCIE